VDALLKKYNKKKLFLWFHTPNVTDERSSRNNKLMERFTFVAGTRQRNFKIHPPQYIDPETGYLRYLPAGETKEKWCDYRFTINTYLEHGESFEQIAHRLGLDPALINYDIFRYYKELPEDRQGYEKLSTVCPEGYVIFYTSAVSGNTIDGFNRGSYWTMQDWLTLAEKVRAKTGCRIVIVGAAYDLDYLKALTRLAGKDFNEIFINTVGQYDMPETLVILKHARFVVGYPSGIPISATYLGTRTAMFWRPQHLSISPHFEKFGFCKEFATIWVPPEMLSQKKYLDLWYSIDTPETVFNRMMEAGW
jgi:hypothetical protein